MHILEKRLKRIRGKLKNRTIYAMGSQENLSKVASAMGQYSLSVEAVLDNDVRKRNTHAMFDVFLPSDKLIPYKKDVVILIYSPGYWKEMISQLKELGYKSSQIFVLNDKYTGTGGIRAFAGSTMRIYYGRRIYSEIVRDIDGDFEILLMRGATGDVYLNGLFLKDY
nr:hypothetical protein [Lachnospiraceae bacterium]